MCIIVKYTYILYIDKYHKLQNIKESKHTHKEPIRTVAKQ